MVYSIIYVYASCECSVQHKLRCSNVKGNSKLHQTQTAHQTNLQLMPNVRSRSYNAR